MEIFNWLSNNEFILDYKILEYWTKLNESYLKLKINFIDNSELHVREHLDSELKRKINRKQFCETLTEKQARNFI
jgi:hypothetical protein